MSTRSLLSTAALLVGVVASIATSPPPQPRYDAFGTADGAPFTLSAETPDAAWRIVIVAPDVPDVAAEPWVDVMLSATFDGDGTVTDGEDDTVRVALGADGEREIAETAWLDDETVFASVQPSYAVAADCDGGTCTAEVEVWFEQTGEGTYTVDWWVDASLDAVLFDGESSSGELQVSIERVQAAESL